MKKISIFFIIILILCCLALLVKQKAKASEKLPNEKVICEFSYIEELSFNIFQKYLARKIY